MGYGPDLTTEGYTIGQENPSYTGGAYDNELSDGAATGAWYAYFSGSYQVTGWTGQDFGSGNSKKIAKYRVYPVNTASRFYDPKDWTFQYSDNGSDWTTIDTRSGESFTRYSWNDYTFSNDTAHRYWRINVTLNNSDLTYLIIQEIEMMESDIEVDLSDEIGVQDVVNAFNLTDSISDGIGLTDLLEAEGGTTFATAPDNLGIADAITCLWEHETQPISDGIGLADIVDAWKFPGVLTDGFGLQDSIQGAYEYQGVCADGLGISDIVDGLNWTEWIKENRDLSVTRFFFTLTGAPDGKIDIEIPISAFQARKRTGYDTYLNVTIKGFTYSTYVTNRPNGEMVLELGYEINGTIQLREEILRVDMTKIGLSQGARNQSITLTGYKTQTFVNQTTIIENPNYKSTDDGRILYRFPQVDPFINPGDTCQVDSDEFTVDYITYVISERYSMMEVRET